MGDTTAMFTLPGLRLRDHTFTLPLDHASPDGPSIQVFAREVVAADADVERLPWLVFLQGGPGFESPRPIDASGWIGKAVERFRVLLLDQRGTGRSTPLTTPNILAAGVAAAQARLLAHFRADSIVRDCESIRRELVGRDERWTVLGQSFGGFCALRYLSDAPEGLAALLITGGVPGLEVHARDVYRRTYRELARKNARLFERFPGSAEAMVRVCTRLERGDVRLPSGDPLSTRRLQSIGAQLGFSTGAAQLHYLLERAFVPGTDEFSRAFVRGVENLQSFDTNPFYAVLHEACYAQGEPTAWAAEAIRGEHGEFDAAARLNSGEVPYFTGEMVYPWMFEEIGELAPLKAAAERLAQKEDWPRLYDLEALRRSDVPVAAAVYFEDMFVPSDLSLETAAAVPRLDAWVTNEFEHDGLRADGARLLGALLGRAAIA